MVIWWLYVIVIEFPIHLDLTHSLPFSPMKVIHLSVIALGNPVGLIRITILRVIPILTHYFDIVSDILSQIIYGRQLAYIFWHSCCHSFWHSFWQSFWHFIWHIFRHSIWHLLWHSFDNFLASYFDILSDIPFDILSLALYLTYVLTFYLPIFLHFSNILCSGPVVAHCLQSARYRVRVQAWPTASGARDMARIHSCPQSQRSGRGGHEEEDEEEKEKEEPRLAGGRETGTTNSLVEDPWGSSSGHWTIKRARSKYQVKVSTRQNTAPIRSKCRQNTALIPNDRHDGRAPGPNRSQCLLLFRTAPDHWMISVGLLLSITPTT